MKKYRYLIPLLGLLFACVDEKKQAKKASEAVQEQTEIIVESTEKLDETMQSSNSEMKETQEEIDSLLNNI